MLRDRNHFQSKVDETLGEGAHSGCHPFRKQIEEDRPPGLSGRNDDRLDR
jgi:hypothetical protein